jgi:hypothetical protein
MKCPIISLLALGLGAAAVCLYRERSVKADSNDNKPNDSEEKLNIELKSIQRVLRIKPDYHESSILISDELDSAHYIFGKKPWFW